MKVIPIISQSYSSNTYILQDEKTEKTCIVDPGCTKNHLDKILQTLNKIKKMPDFVICTHCHYDHVANASFFSEKGIKIFLSEINGKALMYGGERILANIFYGEMPKILLINFLEKELNLGKTVLKILNTPGHTPGSISVYEEKTKSLFVGDLVFVDGIGRTDLPGGNFKRLKESLHKIMRLDFSKFYPGHGKIGTYAKAKKIIQQLA